jgi:hypothetical protein
MRCRSAGYVGGAVTDLLLRSEHRARVYDALSYESPIAVCLRAGEAIHLLR